MTSPALRLRDSGTQRPKSMCGLFCSLLLQQQSAGKVCTSLCRVAGSYPSQQAHRCCQSTVVPLLLKHPHQILWLRLRAALPLSTKHRYRLHYQSSGRLRRSTDSEVMLAGSITDRYIQVQNSAMVVSQSAHEYHSCFAMGQIHTIHVHCSLDNLSSMLGVYLGLHFGSVVGCTYSQRHHQSSDPGFLRVRA